MIASSTRISVPPRAAVLLAVGPGPIELARLADLGDSLLAFAPRLARLLVVDDAQRPAELLSALPGDLRPVAHILANPRHGHELGWREGLNIGIWAGLRDLAAEPAYDFVLKLDTDSLVIAPPLEAIATALRTSPQTGLLGTWRTDPTGLDTGWRIFAPWVRLLARRLAQYRDPVTQRRRFRSALGPRGRRQRRLLASALSLGYEPGEHCQGGGYALSGLALASLNAAGHLRDSFLWGHDPLTEDVALALCVRALGFELLSGNARGDPFGVQYTGLPFPPVELAERGHAIIHSVKNDPAFPEQSIRAWFRGHRSAA